MISSETTKVSIVIPTYGRGQKLGATLDALLASDTNGLDDVEIIVVDDGSPEPVASVVSSRVACRPISLRCMRQPNAGPAAARNTGFRASRGVVVIFIDDDILCPPDLIRRHIEAHRSRPGSVICGRCPFNDPEPMTPLFRYIGSLGHDLGRSSGDEFVEITVVASGQISVERAFFAAEQGVYRDDLATPVAEEFELSLRLRDRGIPILLATRIVAVHDHDVDIENMCRQVYKHSLGCAEAVAKYPGTLDLEGLRDVIQANSPIEREDSARRVIKKIAKRLLCAGPSRLALVRAIRVLERNAPQETLLALFYKAALSSHMTRGIRDGLMYYSRG
jgi:glycosyltransferase involved in cell wall biosynthesis